MYNGLYIEPILSSMHSLTNTQWSVVPRFVTTTLYSFALPGLCAQAWQCETDSCGRSESGPLYPDDATVRPQVQGEHVEQLDLPASLLTIITDYNLKQSCKLMHVYSTAQSPQCKQQ